MKIPVDVELLVAARIASQMNKEYQNAYVFGFLTGVRLSRKLIKYMIVDERTDYLPGIARATFGTTMSQLSGMSLKDFCAEVKKASNGFIVMEDADVFGSNYMEGETGRTYAIGIHEAVQLVRRDGFDYFYFFNRGTDLWGKVLPWSQSIEDKVSTFTRALPA